ncbi:sialidase family protein [Stackebrandtia nassauensis]|uniref:exo-alpha-sialidase n=1 Tax=Stackebrandtia nassauensis (strain DSM 44728 / CIP 108903 / NRRL B-16338 / NBRC 102104 / LLR-40K-21) TaxID=446470 RepID=D3PZ36_STANL|nr:sialidase family protein [Stackebrandtia nassauensis]ADD45465.1 Exo-alpha-sialidase [Stackebrandtia nassauensis DSM 44728]
MRLLRPLVIAAVAALTVTAGLLTAGPASAAPDVQTIFTKGENGYGCHRIPAILRAGNGDLLAFAEARTEFCGDTGHIDLVMKRSTDDGATWGKSQIVLQGTDDDPDAAATRGNPVPILDESTGRIVLLSTHNPSNADQPRTPYVQHSDDDGQTWSTAKSLGDVIDEPDWGWYATGPGGGIQLTRGEHAGRLVVGVNFSDGSGKNGAALVYSDDGGETWTRGATDVPATDDIIPQELNLFERTDGGIYAAARENAGTNTQTRAFAVSTDAGASFEAPFKLIPDLVGTPKVQGSILRLRATDSGDSYDRVLFASPVHSKLRMTMTIRSSFDEGKTWQSVDEGTVIDEDRAGYSNMAVLGNGDIGLLYEAGAYPDGDARDDIRFARISESDLGVP